MAQQAVSRLFEVPACMPLLTRPLQNGLLIKTWKLTFYLKCHSSKNDHSFFSFGACSIRSKHLLCKSRLFCFVLFCSLLFYEMG
jgi:hypothetical protein